MSENISGCFVRDEIRSFRPPNPTMPRIKVLRAYR